MQLLVLGQLSVVDSFGRAVPIRGSRIQQVLSALALNCGRIVTTDALIEALWGEKQLQRDPGPTLRTYVARVRQVGDGFKIDREGSGYRLSLDAGLIDATAFEQRATGGLAHWRAGNLAECSSELRAASQLWGGEPWESVRDWQPAAVDATRLRELHQAVVEHDVASRLAQGRTDVVGDLRGLVMEEPLREFRWALLMRGLAVSGQQAEALRCYQEARSLFLDQVGLEPSEDLRALDAAIAQHNIPPLVPAPDQYVDTAKKRPVSLEQSELVNRTSETSAVRTVLEGLWSAPAVLTIRGEPGIGKSRLAEEVGALAADQGLRVVRGRCFEAEASGAYRAMLGPVRQLIEMEGIDADEQKNLRILLPELSDQPDLNQMGEDRQLRLFDSLARVVSGAAAPHGLALIIDDLQWIDAPSAALLSHVVRHNHNSPILLAVTYRDNEVRGDHPVVDWLSDVARHVEITPLSVTGLSTDDCAQLLGQSWSRADGVSLADLVEITNGNPLFVREFGRLMHDRADMAAAFSELPPSVTTLLDQRLSGLPTREMDLLSRLAVSPGGLALEQLLGTSPLEGTSVIDSLESTMSRGLTVESLEDSEILYDFSHGLFRLTVANQLSLARQAALHHELALAGTSLLDSGPDRWTARIAYHWFMAGRSGNPVRAEEFNRLAGELALRGTAYADATTHFERAIEAHKWQHDDRDTAELHLQAAESCSRAGFFERRRAHSEESFTQAVRAGRAATAARAALVHGGTRSVYGSPNVQTTEMLRGALDLLSESDSELDPDLLAMVKARYAQELNHNGQLAESRRLTAEAVQLSADSGDDRVAAAVFRERIWTLNHPDHLDERRRSIDRMLDKATSADDPELELEARVWNAAALLEMGEADSFEREVIRLDDLGGRAPVPALLVRVSTLKATQALTRGRYQDGMELAAANHALGLTVEPENAEQVLRAQMIAPLRDMGLLESVADQVAEMADQYATVTGWQCAAAYVLSEIGDSDLANRIVGLIADEGVLAIRRDLAWAQAVTYLSAAVANLGRTELVGDLYDAIAPFEGRYASLWDIASNGSFDHYLGVLAISAGDNAKATQHLTAAVRMNEAAGHVPAWLWSRVALHEAENAAGAGPTDTAEEIADDARSLEFTAVVERCEQL